MAEKTDAVRKEASEARPLDAIDRKLLGALARDAGLSYAALGESAGLSPAAAHDRVRKLRASGRIRGVEARLDGPGIGKPFLAFVLVDTQGWCKRDGSAVWSTFPEVEEIHSVAGDACLMLKVRCASSRALEALLERIYATEGVVATKSYVALSTYLERSPQAEITQDFTRPMGR